MANGNGDSKKKKKKKRVYKDDELIKGTGSGYLRKAASGLLKHKKRTKKMADALK